MAAAARVLPHNTYNIMLQYPATSQYGNYYLFHPPNLQPMLPPGELQSQTRGTRVSCKHE